MWNSNCRFIPASAMGSLMEARGGRFGQQCMEGGSCPLHLVAADRSKLSTFKSDLDSRRMPWLMQSG